MVRSLFRFVGGGLLALTFALLASVSSAETCTVDVGIQEWSAVTDGISATCTESADDDFVIGRDTTVLIADAIALTSGSILVQDGGLLVQPCNAAITFSTSDGGSIQVDDGGTFRRTGCVLARDRIRAIDWTTSDTTATLTIPRIGSTGVAAGDYLVIESDPAGLDPKGWIGLPPQTSAANPEAGKFRPSYGRLQWFRITSVSAQTLVIAHDHTTDLTAKGGTFTGTPYEGTRGAAATGSSGKALVGPSSVAIGRGGFASVLTFAESSDDIATYDGDLGGQYVEWTTGNCAGQLAKILWTTHGDGATGNDEVWVAGDATDCGTGDVRIHQGLRVGDPVRIVRPAEINYNQLGHFVWSGGRLEWEHTSDVRLGIVDGATLDAEGVPFSCSFCAYNGNLKSGSHSGFIRSARFGYPDEAAEDTYLLNFSSRDADFDLRASGQYLDLSDFELEDVFIHDQEDDSVGAGGQHGIWTHSVVGFSAKGVRSERMSDDGLGGIFETNYPGPPTRFSLVDVMSYENDANASNTQQCVDYRTRSSGDQGENTFFQNRDLEFVGIACAGANDEAINIVAPNATINAMWLGGSEGATSGGSMNINNTTNPASQHCTASGVPAACCTGAATGTCSYPVGALLAGAKTFVRNSIRFGMGGDATRAHVAAAEFHDSVLASSDAGNDELRNVVGLYRTFVDFDDQTIGINASTTANGAELWTAGTLVFEDSVMRWTAINGTVCNAGYASNANSHGTLVNLVARNLALSFDAHRPDGVFDNCLEGAGAGQGFIDGLWVADSDATPLANGVADNGDSVDRFDGGRQIQRACVEATGARDAVATGFGPNAPASAMHVDDLEPGGDHEVPLRAFHRSAEVGCESYKPREIGLARLHVAHAMLGDLFLGQLDAFSTRELP